MFTHARQVFSMTRGGVSKASKGINLSEDIFAGFNHLLRGGTIPYVEYVQVGPSPPQQHAVITVIQDDAATAATATAGGQGPRRRHAADLQVRGEARVG